MSSRCCADNKPAFPSSFFVESPTIDIVEGRPPSMRCLVELSGFLTLLFGATCPRVLALLLPP